MSSEFVDLRWVASAKWKRAILRVRPRSLSTRNNINNYKVLRLYRQRRHLHNVQCNTSLVHTHEITSAAAT